MLEHTACKSCDFRTLEFIYGYFKAGLSFLCPVVLELRHLVQVNNYYKYNKYYIVFPNESAKFISSNQDAYLNQTLLTETQVVFL